MMSPIVVQYRTATASVVLSSLVNSSESDFVEDFVDRAEKLRGRELRHVERQQALRVKRWRFLFRVTSFSSFSALTFD